MGGTTMADSLPTSGPSGSKRRPPTRESPQPASDAGGIAGPAPGQSGRVRASALPALRLITPSPATQTPSDTSAQETPMVPLLICMIHFAPNVEQLLYAFSCQGTPRRYAAARKNPHQRSSNPTPVSQAQPGADFMADIFSQLQTYTGIFD